MSKIFFLFFFFLLLTSCHSGKENEAQAAAPSQPPPSGPPKRPPIQVETRCVELKNLQVILSGTGYTSPYQESQIASAISGRVTNIDMLEGKFVTKGHILVLVDNTIWKNRLKEKEAEQRNLQAELERLKAGYLVEEIKIKESLVKENLALLHYFEAEAKRKLELFQSNSISKTEWEQARSTCQAQEARIENVKNEEALIKKGFRKELIEAAQANVEKTKAQIGQEKYLLEQTEIKAPFSGVIVQKKIEVGEWLKEGTIVCSLMDIDKIKIVLFVPERYITLVREKKEANVYVTIDALPHRKDIVGKVIEIVPQASQDRNFLVRLLVENPEREIFVGMSCRAFATLHQDPNALMVHRDAFIVKNNQTFVIKVSPENIAEYIPISFRHRDGDWFEIVDCQNKLEDKDKVIVTNNPIVEAGANVLVTREY